VRKLFRDNWSQTTISPVWRAVLLNLILKMVFKRPTDLEGKTRAELIMARRTSLHSKAEYICADLSLDQTPPCSPAVDHTLPGLIRPGTLLLLEASFSEYLMEQLPIL
jgi:hypothetical protein